jgi:hypothetical protein
MTQLNNDSRNEAPSEERDFLTEFFGEPISIYSRAMAIEDGALADISALYPSIVKRFFPLHLAATTGVMAAIERAVESNPPSDEGGMVGFVLAFAHEAARELCVDCDRVYFSVPFKIDGEIKPTKMKLHCGPGDNCEAVLTLMLPSED